MNQVETELQEETNEALIMLAEATRGDKEAIVQLTNTNAELINQVQALNQKVAELTNLVVKLTGGKVKEQFTPKKGYS